MFDMHNYAKPSHNELNYLEMCIQTANNCTKQQGLNYGSTHSGEICFADKTIVISTVGGAPPNPRGQTAGVKWWYS